MAGWLRFRKLFHLRPPLGIDRVGDPAPARQRVDPEHLRLPIVSSGSYIAEKKNYSLLASPFTPWTTLSGYLELLEFVQDHDLVYQLDSVQYSIRLLLPPGSWLLDIPEIRPHAGSLVQEDFVYTWRHPDPRVDMLQRQVALVAEEATSSGEDQATTFNRTKELTLSTIFRPADSRPTPIPPSKC